MNKLKLTIVSIALLFSASFKCQKDVKSEGENIIQKGKNYINVYYGVNIFTSFYKTVASNAAVNIKTSAIGPVGIVYEHLVTDKIGIGVEFGYSSFKLTYNDAFADFNGLITNYDYTWQFTTIRAMFRANFHFAKSDKFDAYGFLSAGYRGTSFNFSTNDPNTSKLTFNGLIPFGLKPGMGFRYFFTPSFGLNAEIAIGTPIICGGLAFKF